MIQKLNTFRARDESGQTHVILTYRDASLWRLSPGEAPVILTTDRGESVHRLGKGQYAIERNPWVMLASDDPEAP